MPNRTALQQCVTRGIEEGGCGRKWRVLDLLTPNSHIQDGGENGEPHLLCKKDDVVLITTL